MQQKSLLKTILPHLIGLAIFIVILLLVNMTINTDNQTVLETIQFFNDNLAIIVSITILFMTADIMLTFELPFNLSAPVFSAIGSVLVVYLVFKILDLLDELLKANIFDSLSWIKWIVYPIVFVIVLISGYLSMLFGLLAAPLKTRDETTKQKMINITPKKKSRSWDDVGDEMKNLFYDIFSGLRKKVKSKQKKK